MNIKKIILPILIVGIVGAFVVYRQFFSKQNNQAPAINDQNSVPSETVNQNPSTGAGTPPSTQTGYKDGQYTGDVANTVYGNVQVKAIITGGKLTDIQMLAYPNSAGHTLELSNSSLPILKSEAIKAQSSHVDVVSGATQTSEGFSQSLASALSKAS